MSEHFKAIVVREDGSMSTVSMDFEGAQKTVGGYVEAVYGISGVVALINEDGRRLALLFNDLASSYLGIGVVGPVVFVGNGGEDFTDAPDDVWESLVRLRPHEAPEAVSDGSGAVLSASEAEANLRNALYGDEARLAEATMLLRSHGYIVTSPNPHTKPKVRSGAPDTSKAIEPKLNSGLWEVLKWLRTTSGLAGGFTDDELEMLSDRTHQSISAARRNGVLRGLIYDSGQRRNTRSGNKAIVWKAVAR